MLGGGVYIFVLMYKHEIDKRDVVFVVRTTGEFVCKKTRKHTHTAYILGVCVCVCVCASTYVSRHF